MSFIAAFRDEISKRLTYWETHRKDTGKDNGDAGSIEKIILTGSEASIAGLPEYLSGSLDTQVVFADVWKNVFDFDEYIPEIEAKDSFKYAGAIGLALEGLKSS
jgi:Tfp pilus assembly PilM family ATPase